ELAFDLRQPVDLVAHLGDFFRREDVLGYEKALLVKRLPLFVGECRGGNAKSGQCLCGIHGVYPPSRVAACLRRMFGNGLAHILAGNRWRHQSAAARICKVTLPMRKRAEGSPRAFDAWMLGNERPSRYSPTSASCRT